MHILSGIYKGKTVTSPKGLKTRPTSGRLRQALFNICQGDVDGANLLDLFAGSGAMGLEALSQGAAKVTFVDNDRESIRCIQNNIQAFEVGKATEVIYKDVFDALQDLNKKKKEFNIIYADPPYESFINKNGVKVSFSTEVVTLLDHLIDMGSSILLPHGSLFIEDAAKAAPNTTESIKHLQLHSSRILGRSTLQHWIRI
ncbi:MAG: 16S rRNA (guanine(966)-N(2))-methyltransferase RsmD [Parachlamydiaceae bacterium]